MDIARPSRKKEIQRKRILIGVVTIAALVAITVALGSLEPAARQVDRGSVWIEAVQRGSFLHSVRGAGTLVPENIRWISAETEAQVERRVLEPGAEVKADSIILELTNPEVEQSMRDAELAMRVAEAELKDLEVRLASQVLDQEANLAEVQADHQGAVLQVEANRELDKSGLVSSIELRRSELEADQMTIRADIEAQRLQKTKDSITAQLRASQVRVEQSRALYELRRDQLEALFVRAGIDGILQEVPVEEGQRVTQGTRLARVAQPGQLKAEVRIAETQAKDILIGQIAKIDTRNGIIDGRVRRIDPSVQQGTVTVDVELTGELPKGARPDLSIDGVIELERLEDVLFTGRPPYGQAYSTIGLYKILDDGEHAERIQVELGATSVNHVEIRSGLDEGDQVILTDSSQWDDAERIRIVD